MLNAQKSMSELLSLWKRLGNIPTTEDCNNESVIDEAFLHFPEGTACESIWRWFESQNTSFIVAEVMQGIIPGSETVRDMGTEKVFDTKSAELRLGRQNYRCEVQDGVVIVEDPYHQNGIIAGYNEVILRNENDLIRFFDARS